jgi:periplasmic protein TonB
MSEKDFSKYNQEDAENNNFSNDDMDASEKTIFISRPTNDAVEDDKTVIQASTPQYSGFAQPDDDATVINMSKNNINPSVDNDATVILSKPNISSYQADDATVFLDKPNIPTNKADDATVILSKPNIPTNKADDSTVILPRQSQPVYQTPRRDEGDDAATIISQPTPRYKQEEVPIAQPPTESVFSKHKNKLLIGIAGLLGLSVGTYLVTQSAPTVVVKQVVQPAQPPQEAVMEPTPVMPAPVMSAPVENIPPPTVAPVPVVSNIKKNLPKPKVSKPAPVTTYSPTTAPVVVPQTRAEAPKVVEDQPDEPLKPIESKPTGNKTYLINELSQMPEFNDVDDYLKRHVKYPDEAKRNKIKGSVFIAVTIEADGKVGNARILKSLGSGCDEAALEAVRKMPKWKAGKANGQNVRSEVSVKVPFQ